MPTGKDLHSKSGEDMKIRKGKNGTGLSLSLYVDKKSGEISVKVIDNKSLEVIKDVPPKELLDIKDRIVDMAGVLFNKKIECKERP